MKIELIVDENCPSLNTHIEMAARVVREFPGCGITITPFDADEIKLRKLRIQLLPAWLIDNELLQINPGNFEMLKKQIRMKYHEKND